MDKSLINLKLVKQFTKHFTLFATREGFMTKAQAAEELKRIDNKMGLAVFLKSVGEAPTKHPYLRMTRTGASFTMNRTERIHLLELAETAVRHALYAVDSTVNAQTRLKGPITLQHT